MTSHAGQQLLGGGDHRDADARRADGAGTQQPSVRTHRPGFTLIELSIVLVIIALIIGGVLAGRELIFAANIRKTIAQKESFDVAVNTFKTKYNYLPGDVPNATAMGLNTSSYCGNCNGNGDGNIATVGAFEENDEYKLFWLHLSNAGLLQNTSTIGGLWYGLGPTAPGYHSPTCPICRGYALTYAGSTVQTGGWWVQQLQNYSTLNCGIPGYDGGPWTSHGGQLPNWNAFIITDGGGVAGGGQTVGELSAIEAYSIDAKIDDGLPETGNVIAISSYTYSDAACSGSSFLPAIYTACNIGGGSGANQYASTSAVCGNLIVRANF